MSYRDQKLLLGVTGIFITAILIILGVSAFKNSWDPISPGPIFYYVAIGIIFILSIIFTAYQVHRIRNDRENHPLIV